MIFFTLFIFYFIWICVIYTFFQINLGKFKFKFFFCSDLLSFCNSQKNIFIRARKIAQGLPNFYRCESCNCYLKNKFQSETIAIYTCIHTHLHTPACTSQKHLSKASQHLSISSLFIQKHFFISFKNIFFFHSKFFPKRKILQEEKIAN